MRKLPPLNSIRVFDIAARHESFTKAAKELDMTQAAVSYQIKVLEGSMGISLFKRTPGRVKLTEIGRRLAPKVSESFAMLTQAFRRASKDDENSLTIAVRSTFAAAWLLPRIDRFEARHPDIQLQLQIRSSQSEQHLDLVDHECDAAVWIDIEKSEGLDSDLLFPAKLTPVISPALAESLGKSTLEPADLLSLPLVGHFEPWWRRWFSAADMTVTEDQVSIVAHGTQYIEGAAAVAGRGVALVVPFFFSEEICSGSLLQPFEVYAAENISYHFYCLDISRRQPKIVAFRRWLLAELANRDNC